MADQGRKILACSCDDSMALDGEALRRACRGADVQTARQLCRAEAERFRTIAAEGGSVTVTCTQEAPLFSEIAEEATSAVRAKHLKRGADSCIRMSRECFRSVASITATKC